MSALPRSTRREFLQGKAAADTLAEVTAGLGEDFELPPPSPGNYLLKVARRAMACQFECYFNAGQYGHAGELALAALDLVDRLEDQLSVFREHSEISRLNRLACDEPIAVEPRLFALLQTAIAIHAATGGAYDVTSGPLSRLWGFTRRAGAIPDAAELDAARQHVGSQYLSLDSHETTVCFLKPGMEINLGSIGKGHALDRCAELFAEAGINDFLLHGGNSSVLARGAHGQLSSDQAWLVGVRHPLRPERRVGQLRQRPRAGHVRIGNAILHARGPPLRTHSRSAQRLARRGSLVGQRARAHRGRSRCTVHRVVRDGTPACGRVLRGHPEVGCVMFCPGRREGSIERHMYGVAEHDWTDLDAAQAADSR